MTLIFCNNSSRNGLQKAIILICSYLDTQRWEVQWIRTIQSTKLLPFTCTVPFPFFPLNSVTHGGNFLSLFWFYFCTRPLKMSQRETKLGHFERWWLMFQPHHSNPAWRVRARVRKHTHADSDPHRRHQPDDFKYCKRRCFHADWHQHVS